MRFVAYAELTEDEYRRVKALAGRDRQSISNFVRGCINDRLAEEDSTELLEHTNWTPMRMAKAGVK